MPDSLYGLVEMLLFYGVLLAFLIWQLVVTRRSIRKDRERDEAAASIGRPDQAEDNGKNL